MRKQRQAPQRQARKQATVRIAPLSSRASRPTPRVEFDRFARMSEALHRSSWRNGRRRRTGPANDGAGVNSTISSRRNMLHLVTRYVVSTLSVLLLSVRADRLRPARDPPSGRSRFRERDHRVGKRRARAHLGRQPSIMSMQTIAEAAADRTDQD